MSVDPRLVDEIARRIRAQMNPAAVAGSTRRAELADQARFGGRWDTNVSLHGEVVAAGKANRRVARYIDHTLLKPESTVEQVHKLCDEARRFGFYSVCLNTSHIPLAAKLLAGSKTIPIAVVGFPLGAALAHVIAYEAAEAIRAGAREIDMVINIGAIKSGDYKTATETIRAVVEASRPYPVKVILETSKLTDAEKVAACVCSKAAGAHFVKTSTGFGGGGATLDDVRLMRRVVGNALQVKASGGVRNLEQAQAMIAAGADRIGASSSVAIVSGQTAKGGY